MLKKGIMIVCVLLALAGMVYAGQEIVDLTLLKENYGAGETVQMRLTTERLERPLKAEQLALYVNGSKIPIAPFFTRYSEQVYLVYFDLPLVMPDGPVASRIENVLYRGSAGLQEYVVEKEISIAPEAASSISFIPGFIVLGKEQEDIQVQVENRKGDAHFNISAPPSIQHVYQTPQMIAIGSKRIFKFKVDQSKLETDAAIVIHHGTQTYTIPIMKQQEITETAPANKTQEQEENKLAFIATKSEVKRTITKDTALAGTLSLKNEGNATLENITLAWTGNLEVITGLDTTFIPSLRPGEVQQITIHINKDQGASPGTYEGNLVARAATVQATFPLSIVVEGKQPDQQINRTTMDLNLNASEPAIQTQNFDLNLSRQQQSQREKEYPLGLIIMTLLIVLMVLGFYILKRKKATKEESFDDYLKNIRK